MAQEEALRKQHKREKEEEAARIKREAEERKKAEEYKAAEGAARRKREAYRQREGEKREEAEKAEWLDTHSAQLERLMRRDEAVKARKKSIISEQNKHDLLTKKYGSLRNSRGTCVCLGCEARFNRLLGEKVRDILLS